MKNNFVDKLLYILYGSTLLVCLIFYAKGYDTTINWHVTTAAQETSHELLPFSKGPFNFSYDVDKYELIESFSAGPIIRDWTVENGIWILWGVGFCLLLSVITFLPRFWFFGGLGLMLFFLINLRLQDISIFGLSDSSAISALIVPGLFVALLYLINLYGQKLSLLTRSGFFGFVVIAIFLFSGVDTNTLTNQLMLGSYVPLVIISILFVFLVAEENMVAILYLVTKSKGGTSNHIHFSVFSVIYLGILIAAYGSKSGMLDIDIQFFDPYGLLAISAIVALFTISLKKDLIDKTLPYQYARKLILILGVIVFSFLSLIMSAGFDAIYESLHYFILYAHVGFGVMFFLYVIINFVNPLSKGLQIYKIAYKEQNFPYVTAKLGGTVAVVAFFLLANNEPLRLIQAGRYNILGTQAEQNQAYGLATRYYEEGAIYGHDNHYSNYKLGYQNLKEGQLKEANYYFGRAKNRYPSAQAYINYAGTYAKLNQATLSQVALESGQNVFPNNEQIQNNLGLIYLDQGESAKAMSAFGSANTNDDWNRATQVNYWKIAPQQDLEEDAENAYQQGNLPVKANILSRALPVKNSLNFSIDTSGVSVSFPLHRIPYLINASWYFQDTFINPLLQKPLDVPINESLLRDAQLAMIFNEYANYQVNTSLLKISQMAAEASSVEIGDYFNMKGLMLLENHAPVMAIPVFEEAIRYGHPEAELHLLVALLEAGQFKQASIQLEEMLQKNPVFEPLSDELAWLNTQLESPALSQIYYQYRSFDPKNIASFLSEMDEAYRRSFWHKIALELLSEKAYIQLSELMTVFKDHLPKQDFIETELIIDFVEGQDLQSSKHPLYLVFQIEHQNNRISALYQLATQNALNEPLTIVAVSALQKEDPERAYNALLESININQRSVALHKLFVQQAIDLALFEYADSGLSKLRILISAEEFKVFQAQINQQKAEIEADSWQ